MGAYVGVDVLCECEVFCVWRLTRKRSLGMNTRQAQGWERIGRTDARMKKIFARMQSNGNTADENFWRDTVEPIHVLRKFLNGCSRTDTRLTKIFERIRTKGWTAEEKLWTDGCVMCRVFLANSRRERGTYSMHIFLRSRKSFACSRVKMMNENNWAFLNPLISYDVVFFLFKLCDANLWRFQFQSAWKIKSFIDKFRVLLSYRLRFRWSTLIDMLRPV